MRCHWYINFKLHRKFHFEWYTMKIYLNLLNGGWLVSYDITITVSYLIPTPDYISGAFNKFSDFFVLVFEIVVDSWKFTMLLLDILWDDWRIFLISGSNEPLQQELEYTLLKPDCHSWWISKMQSGRENTLEERYAIEFCFKLGKTATETYGILQTAFRPSCMNRQSVFEWHKRFKEGRVSVTDDERCGRIKKVRTPELIGQRVRVNMSRF